MNSEALFQFGVSLSKQQSETCKPTFKEKKCLTCGENIMYYCEPDFCSLKCEENYPGVYENWADNEK